MSGQELTSTPTACPPISPRPVLAHARVPPRRRPVHESRVHRYNKFIQIAARATRAGLKEEERLKADKRNAVTLKWQSWKEGKGGPQVRYQSRFAPPAARLCRRCKPRQRQRGRAGLGVHNVEQALIFCVRARAGVGRPSHRRHTLNDRPRRGRTYAGSGDADWRASPRWTKGRAGGSGRRSELKDSERPQTSFF